MGWEGVPIENDIDVFLPVECHAEGFAYIHIVEGRVRRIENHIACT